MLNPEKQGAQAWAGVHVTHQTTVSEIFNVDNVGPRGALLSGWDMFRFAGESLDTLIQDARKAGTRILPIGAGWALSKIPRGVARRIDRNRLLWHFNQQRQFTQRPALH